MPRKKKVATTAKPAGKMSASDFVRSQPRTMTAPQVVEAGKAKGLKFSQNLVYAVRAAAKKKSGGGRGRKGAAASRAGGGSSEAAFRQLVVDLGISRARALVNEVEGALAKVIRGG